VVNCALVAGWEWQNRWERGRGGELSGYLPSVLLTFWRLQKSAAGGICYT